MRVYVRDLQPGQAFRTDAGMESVVWRVSTGAGKATVWHFPEDRPVPAEWQTFGMTTVTLI